jgi:hypothetical protein
VVMLVVASSKIASSRRRHLVLGMFGHVPFWGRNAFNSSEKEVQTKDISNIF